MISNLLSQLMPELQPPAQKNQYLVNTLTKEQIPLRNVNVDIKIVNSISTVKFIQEYENVEECPIEVEYLLPVDPAMAVSDVEIDFGDRKVWCQLMERNKAKVIYEDAVAGGKTAAFAAPSRKQGDVIKFNIGNFPPKSKATMVVSGFMQLEVEDLSWCFRLPLTIVPKYMGNASQFVATGKNFKDSTTEDVPMVSKQEQMENMEDIEEAKGATFMEGKGNAYTWNLNLELTSTAGKIVRFVSTTHSITGDFNKDLTYATARLTDEDKPNFPDGEFVLIFKTAELNKPCIAMQDNGQERAIMMSFFADFTPEEER